MPIPVCWSPTFLNPNTTSKLRTTEYCAEMSNVEYAPVRTKGKAGSGVVFMSLQRSPATSRLGVIVSCSTGRHAAYRNALCVGTPVGRRFGCSASRIVAAERGVVAADRQLARRPRRRAPTSTP